MRPALLVTLLGLAVTMPIGAQSPKPAITPADYGQWEALATAGARGGLSPDGRWLAYAINRSNRNNELRVAGVADGTTTAVAFGAQPVFSSDSKWVAYSIGHSEAEQLRVGTGGPPLQNQLGLMNLTTRETTSVDGIESFAFSQDGAYLAMRRYGPAPAGRTGGPPATPGRGGGGRGAAAGDDGSGDALGATLIVRHLASGRDTTFGNVSEFAWQEMDHTHRLAMIVSAEGKTGNGVHLFDAETAVLRVLDSMPTGYVDLAWRKDAADLVVLRAKTDDRRDGPTFVALAWTALAGAEGPHVYDPTADPSFPVGRRTVSFRRPSWSDDGHVVFLGIAKWDDKPAMPGRTGSAGASGRRNGGAAGAGANGAATAGESTDDTPTVDIWHWTDVMVMPRQKLSATADRRRNALAAWHLDSGAFVPLSTDPVNEQVTPIRHTSSALVAEWSAYAMDRTIGRPAADLYVEDIATGARTKLKTDVNDRYGQISPNGRYLLFLEHDHFWAMNLATRAVTDLTKGVPTSFIDKESDETIVQKPPFGAAGWTKDDSAVILYDKFDLWLVPVDGSKATRLTDGTAEQIRSRYVRLNPDDEGIDLSKPSYVSLFGLVSKKSGYGELTRTGSGGPAFNRLVWLDKSVDRLARAKDADVYAYAAQDYDSSPNIFVGGAHLADAKALTNTNPFQSHYAWGTSQLVDFKTDKGRALQGTLYFPAGYQAGTKYPMIVYVYERLSDNVHRYVVPSDRDYYNTSVFTSQGYFVFEPDIVFTPREPGLSVVECVTAGVKRVTQMGSVDGSRVGIVGHSWGGFDTVFLATHTSGVFAAAVAGAPITDLVSNYGNHHWSSGIAETDHIETGQQRMEVPLYEDLSDYIANSAVFNVQNMTVPLLLECGDADGTVFWHQSVELYNIARRAKKNVVMLVYNGEDHGLRQQKNQTDYQRRILAWFGHYLKGEAAPTWITSGQSYLGK
jgi:dipeptidyl aminopeptidase/acylaminoacyl peptidase